MKFRIYIILAIYLIGCTGVTINYHYCGGELVAVTLYQYDEKNCCGEEEESENCCEDKYLFIDTEDPENPAKASIVSNNPVKLIIPDYQLTATKIAPHVIINSDWIPLNHAPPDIVCTELFIQNQNLRI